MSNARSLSIHDYHQHVQSDLVTNIDCIKDYLRLEKSSGKRKRDDDGKKKSKRSKLE